MKSLFKMLVTFTWNPQPNSWNPMFWVYDPDCEAILEYLTWFESYYQSILGTHP